jgi:hypothetical protein
MTTRAVRGAIVALITIIALMTSVLAQSRKVLVLPLDGNASADRRSAVTSSLVKAAKSKVGGDVTLGDTTYNETAAAVGCPPETDACAEQVRTTLAVDELVYGSADSENGTTTITVKRVRAGSSVESQVTTVGDSEPADPALETTLGGTAAGSGSGSGSDEAGRGSHTSGTGFFDTRERKLAVGFLAGGAVSIAIGLSLWSSASSLQDDIDGHATTTSADVAALVDLEDRAANKALWGNILVFGGVALAGVGGYFLYKDHKNRSEPVLAPAPTPTGTGMTLVLRGAW